MSPLGLLLASATNDGTSFTGKPACTVSSIGVVALTLLLPFTPLAAVFEFAALPPLFYAVLAGFVVAYMFLVELMKWWFYRKYADISE